MAVDHVEGGDEALAAFLVERADRLSQALDRFAQVVALGDQLVAARLDLGELVVRAQVYRAEPLALLLQRLELALDLRKLRQRRARLVLRQRRELGRLALEFVHHRMQELLAPGAGRFDPRFRRRARFARFRHGVERLAGHAIRDGERGLAGGPGVRRLFPRRLRGVEFVGQRAAAAGEFMRRFAELFALRFVARTPRGDLRNLGLGAFAALVPGAAFGDNRVAALGARFRLAL